MKTFVIEHKYCGCVTTIVGYNFYDACKRNNILANVWTVVGEYNA